MVTFLSNRPVCPRSGMVSPPIIAHASLALNNWRRLDQTGSLELDNLATLQLFQGDLDEQWFYLVAVAIEAQGAPSLLALVAAQQAVVAGQVDHLASNLKQVALALANMIATLMRMAQHCDPHIFYSRIRPFLAGWDAPGIVYEGVDDVPQMFTGASAAQSTLLQSLDAALGVKHRNQEARLFLLEMRRYMPPAHSRFIEILENGPSIRQFVLDHKQSHPALCAIYNQCVDALEDFRRKHLEMAVHYITHQAPKGREADVKGTGGTNFATWLGKARKETGEHHIM